MSIFESLASLLNNGSNDSQGNQPDVTKKNNDKNLLDNLSEGLREGLKSIVSVISPSEPDRNQADARHNDAKFEQRLRDKIDTATEAAERARNSVLELQNQINESRDGHNNQFQNGKLSNPPQAGQKRKELDSESDQNLSQTKKPKTDGRKIQEFSDGTFRILPSLKKSTSNAGKSAREGENMSQNIQNSWDNQEGFVGRNGNVNGQFDPHDKKGTAKFQRQKSGLDHAIKLQNAQSLQESSSESRLTAMRQAQKVAAGLVESEKREGEFLRGARELIGQSSMNVLSGKGGSAGRW